MLLKLYKREKDKILYWEAWEEETEITIHFGELGDYGETITVALAEFEPPETAIAEQAKEARESGFAEVEHEDLYELVVQYKLMDNAGPSDVDRASRLEELLNECLGWTGNGHCDGNEIGGGTLNIYCFVVDPLLSVKPILEELNGAGLADDVVIAYHNKDDSFVVLWPEDFRGPFSY